MLRLRILLGKLKFSLGKIVKGVFLLVSLKFFTIVNLISMLGSLELASVHRHRPF